MAVQLQDVSRGSTAPTLVCSGLITVAAEASVGVKRQRSEVALGSVSELATGGLLCVNVLAVVGLSA